jgi:16S rRNA (guanine527-N7)-methyltransferase
VKQARPQDYDVSRETCVRLETYAALLQTWTRTINLIARADEAHIWPRHIADSLQLIRHIPRQLSHAVDLGSGGGLPGLVLAIATNIPFTLIESDQRKAAFLREAARQTEAPVTVLNDRIEATSLPPQKLVTARALAPLTTLLALAAPLLQPRGILLAMKGRKADTEIDEAQQHWHFTLRKTASVTDPNAAILIISEVHRV